MNSPKSIAQKETGLMYASSLPLTFLALAATLFFNATHLRASDTAVENKEDAAITNEVKISLFYHLSLNFRVNTNDGVVTLSGNADSMIERNLNTKLAAEIKGV